MPDFDGLVLHVHVNPNGENLVTGRKERTAARHKTQQSRLETRERKGPIKGMGHLAARQKKGGYEDVKK